MAAFHIPAVMVAEIISHARTGYPEEVCGIISGRDNQAVTLYRGRNVSLKPRVAYELDVNTLALQISFDAVGLDLAGIYHSHPSGPETPSATDIAQAYYPDAVYIICSLDEPARPSLRGFQIADGEASEIRLVIT
jgi:proteasome lid subunit RPN8/RPN11